MTPLTLTPRPGPLRILCLGAHPDDIEIGCGAAILRLTAENPDAFVHWAVFSGAGGPRGAEARASAGAFLSHTPHQISVLDFQDGFFPYHGAAIKDAFESLKATMEPTLILTHYKGDAHQDHRLVADLTYNTFRDHLILEYEIPKYDGDLANPNLFVAVSEAAARRKIELLLQHFATQHDRGWFSADTFWALLRLRGTFTRAPEGLAEGFYCRKALV